MATLDKRASFKLGFLLRCVDDGLNEDQTLTRIKQARAELRGGLDKQSNWAGLATAGAVFPLALGAATGAAGGAAIGSLASTGGTAEDFDPEELRKRDLIVAYRRAAEKIRAAHAARSYRSKARPRLIT